MCQDSGALWSVTCVVKVMIRVVVKGRHLLLWMLLNNDLTWITIFGKYTAARQCHFGFGVYFSKFYYRSNDLSKPERDVATYLDQTKYCGL